MKKRFMSMLLALCLVLGLFPSVATTAGERLVAVPSKTSFVMNGKPVSIKQAYNINDTNYLQLRAIAELLNGTDAQFNVSWDGKYAVIETGKPFNNTATPAALKTTENVRKSTTSFKLDGIVITFENVYLIDGDTNYLQLREFASKLKGTASQFNVYWDSKSKQAVIVPGEEYIGEAPKNTAPTGKAAITDGWYNLYGMDNYVHITSNGSAILMKDTPAPMYYVKHIEGNKYAIQNADGKYLGVSGKAEIGKQVKLVNTQYLWTLRLEKDNDTFSLRPADNQKMLFNAAGQTTIDGSLICLWTYENEDAPNYAEFRFIPVKENVPVAPPDPTVTTKPEEPTKPTQPTEPTEPSEPTIPYKVYTTSDISVKKLGKGYQIYDAAGNKVTRVSDGYELVIAQNIETIDDYTFYNNYIGKFSVEGNNPNFTTEDGVLFNKDKTMLIAYPGSKKDSKYKVPDSVVTIATGAFAYNRHLQEIEFGSNLKVIGVDAFRGCNFSELVIPESVTTIYGCAFNDIKELKKITLPSGIKMIVGDILSGSNKNVVVYGEYGGMAEWIANAYGYNFVGTATLGFTNIKIGQTESQAGIGGDIFGYFKTTNGEWKFYGSYERFLAVYYENNKAKYLYTNDLTIYTKGGIVYTDSNDNNRQFAASVGYIPDFDDTTTERLILEFTNAFRGLHGLPALRWNDKLAAAARSHSVDMEKRKFFDHINPEGKGPADRITAAGYDWMACAENIYMSSVGNNASGAVNSWVNSYGHRMNLLTTSCDELGVGSSGGYATQNFGKQTSKN